ncbi:hypothetical protein [Vagococcus xieshaowenii]|uniref:Uncharacterized protein n=1 Tax=Vagococcus xieshaowenii TaxID=2562451 RepID=A0AAJ5EH57_9ENTE|nr:hypothetical protein [Vagococcus xieshaowenii]QCA29686.1 hypothetical protein E4Z98_09880 [Vagococcus xieshaowenii]TFZ42961.1 hypothetical protein E4031_01620 [Vagococcus xieshaowenii]
MKKTIISGGILLCLIGGLCGFFVGNHASKNKTSLTELPDTSNTSTFVTKESESEKIPKEESTPAPNSLTKEQEDTFKYNQHLTDIEQVVDDFMEVYDNTSTDDFKEKMKEVYPIMTEEAQIQVRPYYEGDRNMMSIEGSLENAKHFVRYRLGSDYAVVLTMMDKKVRYNGENTVYLEHTIVRHDLLLKDNKWLINSRIEKVFNDSDPMKMFE